jgi:hypothetical protein
MARLKWDPSVNIKRRVTKPKKSKPKSKPMTMQEMVDVLKWWNQWGKTLQRLVRNAGSETPF